MKLIIGLGNPGKKYETTRHNTGFMAVDKIASNLESGIWNLESKFSAEVAEVAFSSEKIILAKPQTFMNESGKAVKTIADYYKIPAENITVIHDDLDIPLGEYKIAQDRGSAGHKGVQSIIDALGTKDFMRIRIGIGAENKKIPAEAFVLENFTDQEKEIIKGVIKKVCGEIGPLIKK